MSFVASKAWDTGALSHRRGPLFFWVQPIRRGCRFSIPMIALARKYRPRKFADVAVQSHVSNTLRGAIAAKRIAHGYLLSGPRGVGKTTLAPVLAMALNCQKRAGKDARRAQGAGAEAAGRSGSNRVASDAGEPCGECESCKRI